MPSAHHAELRRVGTLIFRYNLAHSFASPVAFVHGSFRTCLEDLVFPTYPLWRKRTAGGRNANQKRSIPEPLSNDEIGFRVGFGAPRFRIFVALVIGWMLTAKVHSASHMDSTVRLHQRRQFAAGNRFRGKGQWTSGLMGRSGKS